MSVHASMTVPQSHTNYSCNSLALNLFLTGPTAMHKHRHMHSQLSCMSIIYIYSFTKTKGTLVYAIVSC